MKKIQENIKKDIVDQLAWDSRTDASDIKVEVDGSTATLSGNVPSFAAGEAAKSIAMGVIGVSRVYDEMKVRFPMDTTSPTDSQVKKSVETLLALNSEVDVDDLRVDVDAGMVKLEGSVTSYWEKIVAETEAKSAIGVIDLINKLAVVPTEKISDEVIGERIMDRIDNNTLAEVDKINVKVKDGKVTLSGTVPSYSVWENVNNAAQYTLGVEDVIDQTAIHYLK